MGSLRLRPSGSTSMPESNETDTGSTQSSEPWEKIVWRQLSRSVYCSRRSSTSQCLCFRYLYWFQCVVASRSVHNSSSENYFVNSERISFVLLPCSNSYHSIWQSSLSISRKRVMNWGLRQSGACSRASSRERSQEQLYQIRTARRRTRGNAG